MSQTTRQELLRKYSTEEGLTKLDQLSKAEKEELLFAIGGEKMLEKADKFNWNKKIIKVFCETALKKVLVLDKQEERKKEPIDIVNYKEQYATHQQKYLDNIKQGETLGEIEISKHVFDHVKSDLIKYVAGFLDEKIKHARGFDPNFKVKDYKQRALLNKKYLMLDPERIHLPVINFLKTGEDERKQYTPEETEKLEQWVLDNHDLCKEILLSGEALLIKKDFLTPDENTYRIVALQKGGTKLGYLVSENWPIRYPKQHLKRYQGTDFSFKVFATRKRLEAYLNNQPKYMKAQRERFQETIFYLTALDPEAINEENIQFARTGFSMHGTYADQTITEQLNKLLSSDKRGRKQIIKSIISAAEKGIETSKKVEEKIREHLNALRDNNLF